jgi:hypothetical protein
MWPYNKVASLERDSLVVFYCLSASEIWPDKKGGLIREGLLYFDLVYFCAKFHSNDLSVVARNRSVFLLVSYFRVRIRVMVFNTTFNNISVISWQSVILVEETGVPRENHQPVASY